MNPAYGRTIVVYIEAKFNVAEESTNLKIKIPARISLGPMRWLRRNLPCPNMRMSLIRLKGAPSTMPAHAHLTSPSIFMT